jgi:type II secretory pathway pseudopilin PulG
VSTGLIVAIVIVALIILALLFLLPRMRKAARHKQAERELRSRREAVATEHRQEAAQRETRAEEAERKARMAEQAAQRERAEANLRHERADMHERGMADDELIDDQERDRFAGVAGPDETRDADGDGNTMDDRARAATDRDSASGPTGATAAGTDESSGVRSGTTGDAGTAGTTGTETGATQSQSEYERGREDERRFERNRLTEDVRESDRSGSS